MSLSPQDCCIVNGGKGSWAFDSLAVRLSASLGIDISDQPRKFNYLLHWEEGIPFNFSTFIPIDAVHTAADKRLLAEVFQKNGVSIPLTFLCETFAEASSVVRQNPGWEWCLKFPTSCGGSGHRLLVSSDMEPLNWPRPFVVQEFIRLKQPEVYRTYGIGSELFGWVTRRFPPGTASSSWVAHARGARYSILEDIPSAAQEAARQALQATGLWNSFGCVDLLYTPDDRWLVLEVGTDGLFNHVDRELGEPSFEHELDRRLAQAFWKTAHAIG